MYQIYHYYYFFGFPCATCGIRRYTIECRETTVQKRRIRRRGDRSASHAILNLHIRRFLTVQAIRQNFLLSPLNIVATSARKDVVNVCVYVVQSFVHLFRSFLVVRSNVTICLRFFINDTKFSFFCLNVFIRFRISGTRSIFMNVVVYMRKRLQAFFYHRMNILDD